MSTGPGPIEQFQRAERSRSRTVVRVLALVGLAGLLTCGFVLYRTLRDPDVRELFSTLVGSVDAPGTEELRSAGCALAMVFDARHAVELAQRIAGDEQAGSGAGADLPAVLCQVPGGNPVGLDCAELAAVYAGAVDPATPIMVQLVDGDSGDTLCQDVFAPDGARLGSVEEWLEQSEQTGQSEGESRDRSGAEAPQPSEE